MKDRLDSESKGQSISGTFYVIVKINIGGELISIFAVMRSV